MIIDHAARHLIMGIEAQGKGDTVSFLNVLSVRDSVLMISRAVCSLSKFD